MDETENTPIIVAYFPEWGIYERNHTASDVQAEKITNLIYAFVDVNENFELELFDPWAAVDFPFRDHNSVDGVADLAGQGLMGNFNQLAEMQEAYPHLTIQLGIGGWTLSDNFSDMAATAETRAVFIDSVIAFLKEYTMFDGIDLDWEYPGGGGLPDNSVSEDDGANYALLAAELRVALDALETETEREYTMSAALPAGFDKIENLDIAGIAESLDFMTIMTYDFYGAWDDTTGHLAGFYDLSGGDYDITTAVNLYLEAGVDPSQIVLGLPSYTRAWQGVDVDSPIDGWNYESGGGAPGTYPIAEPAYYEYRDLLEELQAADSDWGLYWDDDAHAAFLYNPTLGIWSSFETPATIAYKSEWAQSLGLGGVSFWDTSGDSNGSESLISAAYASWFEGLTFYEIQAGSEIEFDMIFGGDGAFIPIAEAETAPSDLPEGPPPGLPTDNGDNSGGGAADVTRETADVYVGWDGGGDRVVEGFDPETGTILVDWYGPDLVLLSDTPDGVLIEVTSIRQSWLLSGVTLSELSASNFRAYDAGTEAKILSLIGDNAASDGTGDDAGDQTDNDSGDGAGDDAGDQTGDDAGDGAGDDAGDQTGDDSGDGAGDDTGDDTDDGAGDDAGDDTGDQTDDSTGDGAGDDTDDGAGDDGGDGSGDGTNDSPDDDDYGLGTAGVTAATADVVLNYNGSQNLVIESFDPASHTIFVDWISASQIDFTDTQDGVLIEVPHLRQTWLLSGVTLADLSAGNFTFNDASAAAKILALVGDNAPADDNADDASDDGSGDAADDDTGDDTDAGTDTGDGVDDGSGAGVGDDADSGSGNDDGDGSGSGSDDGAGDDVGDGANGGSDDGAGDGSDEGTDDDSGDNAGDDPDDGAGDDADDPDPVSDGVDVYTLGWNWGAAEVIANFDPTEDVLDFGSLSSGIVAISEVGDDLVIEVLNNGGHTYLLEDTQAEDLTRDNLSAPNWNAGVLENGGGVIDQLTALGFDDLL